MWNNDIANTFAANLAPDNAGRQEEVAREVCDAGQRLRAQLPELTRLVTRDTIAHVPALFSPETMSQLDEHLSALPGLVTERVETKEGAWSIDLLDNTYTPFADTEAQEPFSVLSLATELVEAIASVTGFTSPVVTTRRWVNRYGIGDSIAPHDDTTGDFQIMICLTAPHADCGGELVLANGVSVVLAAGDLLIMKHADVVHWTTPILPTALAHRATATCRYHVDGGRMPRSKVLPHTQQGPRSRVERKS
ncbi:hypothetical protein [Streptomyces puniciscabiei]|uniref:hypothetical protein n=1 Tax=Streptomyces puniciscabiei TaxID=164348 RepID=UPI003330C88F